MERKLKKAIIKEGNLIEIPEEALKILNIEVGDEVKILYGEDVVLLMNPSKFGEELLKKF